jgi:hypothetical protein
MKNSNSKTGMIKSTFSNKVHKLLNPNPVKNSERWKQKKVELSDKEKIELFDKIVAMEKATSNELSSYFFNRRENRRIQRKRTERGYVPKRKTSKAEYEKMLSEISVS